MKIFTKEEFKQYLDKEFWNWISIPKEGRSLDSLLLSMEDWAGKEYNRVSKQENERKCY